MDRDRHGAQAVGQAARTGGLLAEQAQVEGDPLVGGAPGQAADADRREDEVGAGERRVQVGGGRPPAAPARARPPSAGSTCPTAASRASSTSCRTTSSTRLLAGVAQQRAVHEGDAEPAASENGQPHDRSTSTPAAAHASSVSGSAPSLVTSTSMSFDGAHPQGPRPGQLVPVGQQHHLVGGGDEGPLDRHLDRRGVQDLPVGADPARAEEGAVGADLPERVLGEDADQRLVGASQRTAEHHQLDPVVVAEHVHDGQARGHHGHRAPAQPAGQHHRRGADVQQQHVAVAHGLRRQPGHPVLVRGVRGRHLGEGPIRVAVQAGAPAQVRAAVDPGQHPRAVQLLQVAADRGGADVQLAGEVLDRHDAAGAQLPHDVDLPAVPHSAKIAATSAHIHAVLRASARFCLVNVDAQRALWRRRPPPPPRPRSPRS